MKLILVGALATTVATTYAQSFTASKNLDAAIEQAIGEKKLPGAVLIIGQNGRIVHRKAYGSRSLEPTVEPMTVETIFDLASLTKVIATTSSVMKLYEQGKIRLNDRVVDYIPEFQGGKSDVTVRNLLTHFSGLRPDVSLTPKWSGYEKGIELACNFPIGGPPGVRHVYSDINFILLGEIVHRISGVTLAEFARTQIFEPIGMQTTRFQPPQSWFPRVAPTERPTVAELPLRGVVHDPTARNMGGIAGHAGLFSTADDLAKFAQMMLNEGELGGKRVFGAYTVKKFTSPQTPYDQPIERGFGWDIDSPYSSNRGDLFPIGSYGHTGFTGTSIWIDPTSKSYVILLTNAVHPVGKGSVLALRSKVATITAAALGVHAQTVTQTGYNETVTNLGRRRDVERTCVVKTGLDVLVATKFAALRGKHVGLITNHTGLSADGHRNVDLMKEAGIDVIALFSPEHGWAGAVDHSGIKDDVDAKSGIKVYSLYGEHLHPSEEMLKGLDALVFDIQDVGVRFYTYEATMAYAMESAAKAGIDYYVLDRPNPITGTRVEGPILDPKHVSFVGYMAGSPARHGMTMGELATMFNAEKKLGAKLHVVQAEGWSRGDWFDATNLSWTNPSPNMRSLNAAMLYPGICLIEFPKNLSVGRGTDSPFEQIGADFINGRELAATLNKREIPGVRVYPTSFTPTEAKFAGVHIEGVRFVITDRDKLDPTRLGLECAVAIQKLYPGKIDFHGGARLIGSDDVIERIIAGQDPMRIRDAYREATDVFLELRKKYLIYP